MNDHRHAKAVAYYRVSTGKQGKSGLGLDAQREAVSKYLTIKKLELVDQFEEVETGKGSNALSRRPELVAALAAAKKAKAVLIIAKLDRLARNVHFISGLMETGVEFAVADMPNADRFQLHLFAALAENEAEMISRRTKVALAAAKERGQVLGTHGKVQAARNKAEALERLEPILPMLRELRGEGLSIRRMAATLNDRGVASPGGGKWSVGNLHKALARLAA
jgi:DNA invertase Pin-like site-specific DNA recombinase